MLSAYETPRFVEFGGIEQKYRPDFLVRLKTGSALVLETKGEETQQDMTKRDFLRDWIRAVNTNNDFGHWQQDASKHPDDITEVLARAVAVQVHAVALPTI